MHNNIAQLELPTFMGKEFDKLPDDLFIPPNALEICLETFSGPLDLLLYLIRKENINILDEKWKNEELMALNGSQLKALKAALSKEISVIQGNVTDNRRYKETLFRSVAIAKVR